MKRILFTLLLVMAFMAGYSQLQNNGGTITVQPGATVVIQGNYTSTNAGVIEIDGSVQLKGNFINNGGNIHANSTGTLTFNGTAAQDISGTVPTDFYCGVVVDNAGNGVSLTGADAVLYNALTLTNGKMTLNAYDLTMAAVGITATSTNYVVTNSTGELKASVAAVDVTYPVGTASSYNPVMLNNTGGTADTYGVVYSGAMPGGWTGGTDHAVTGHWTVSEGTALGSDLDVTPLWNGVQEQPLFTRADCAVGVSADDGATVTWGTFGAALGTDPYTRVGSGFTGIGKFLVGDSFFNAIVLNLDLFLAGAFVGGGTMSTTLNTEIPLDDPFGNTALAPAIPVTAVDWIEVELRDQANFATVLYSQSFFLDQSGDVLNYTDGASGAVFTGVPRTNYYIAINQRNHLSVITPAAVDLNVSSPAYNFTTAQTQAWQDPAITGNTAMAEVETGVFGLWAGDCNGDGLVDYAGGSSDRSSIVGQLGSTTLGIPAGPDYFGNDINLDTFVDYAGGSSDRSVLVSTLGSTTLGIPKESHLP